MEDSLLVRNLTLTKPMFSVYHLRPATRFEATIYSSNRKGRSSPSLLRVSTLKRPSEKRLATTASGRTWQHLRIYLFENVLVRN
jgi:hypothetical protein